MSIKQPERRRTPITCIICREKEVWSPVMGACDTCFNRLWREFRRIIGWEIQ